MPPRAARAQKPAIRSGPYTRVARGCPSACSAHTSGWPSGTASVAPSTAASVRASSRAAITRLTAAAVTYARPSAAITASIQSITSS